MSAGFPGPDGDDPSNGDIEQLARLLARLPGLGPKSARRAVLHLLKRRESFMLPLAQAMRTTAESIKTCRICGNFDTTDPCGLCQDARRERGVICVVADVADLWALERSEQFRGQYHVLGGMLSALDGIGPEQLKIAGLRQRAAADSVTEVILALNATVEGQTTAHVVADELADCNVTVTRLAHGVPMGGELDYMDGPTLGAALQARRAL